MTARRQKRLREYLRLGSSMRTPVGKAGERLGLVEKYEEKYEGSVLSPG